jgi:hypothetical protein
VAVMLTAGVAQAWDRRIEVVNRSSYVLHEFYATNSGETRWENDKLFNYEIFPNQSYTIDLDDGTGRCRFDLKVITRGGKDVIRYDIDICSISTWSIYDK